LCRAGSSDEGTELGRVFFAGGEFDSGDDIDAARIKEVDGVGDVFRIEAASDDDRLVPLDALDERERRMPVKSLASAAAGGCRARVEQESVDEAGVCKIPVELG